MQDIVPRSTDGQHTTRPSKILIVEDDVFIVDLVAHELAKSGFLFDIAANGTDAVKKFTTFQPTLILLDIRLPDASGIEVLKKIRTLRGGHEVKVVVFSNIAEDVKNNEGKDLGIDRFIVKANFTLQEVSAMIREVLAS